LLSPLPPAASHKGRGSINRPAPYSANTACSVAAG